MGIAELIALSMGLAWASGVNLYATLAVLGIMGASGHMVLPAELQVVAHPAVIGAACVMYVIEFFADKIPGVDTGWDTLHTFIRIPAGAVLAAGALGDISPAAQVAALIIGGGISATSHGVKAGTRVLINASPEPFSNWAASTTEDVVVVGGLLTALYHPLVFIGLTGVFIIMAIWLLPKLWRGIREMFRRLGNAYSDRSSVRTSAKSLFKPEALPPPDGGRKEPAK
jgi:hypothetical protein